MKMILRKLLALSALFLSCQVYAGITCTNNPQTPTLTATIPISSMTTVGSPANRYLTDWFYAPTSGYSTIYSGCTAVTSTLQGRVTLTPAGSRIDGYPIFKTNVPGIGIIIKARNRNADPGAALDAGWTDVFSGVTSYWDSSFGARLVSTTETIVSGTVANLGTVAQLKIVDKADITGSNTIIPVNLVIAGSVSFTSKTCLVSSNSKNIAVPLGTVKSTDFAGPGSTAGYANFAINLESCSSGLKVNMTFSDSNNLGNNSNVLTLTPDGSQASGVGIRIVNQSTMQPVSYGPDSAVVGNTNQFFVVTAGSPTVAIPFSASYVKTGAGTIAGGSANGVATFTMSYQ